MIEPILEIRGLKKYFQGSAGFLGKKVRWVQALDNVSFEVYKGETFGLVGRAAAVNPPSERRSSGSTSPRKARWSSEVPKSAAFRRKKPKRSGRISSMSIRTRRLSRSLLEDRQDPVRAVVDSYYASEKRDPGTGLQDARRRRLREEHLSLYPMRSAEASRGDLGWPGSSASTPAWSFSMSQPPIGRFRPGDHPEAVPGTEGPV